MSVDRDTVSRIASLARLKVPEQDIEKLAAELSNIILWVDQLNEIDAEDTAPMTSVSESWLRWRSDEVTDGKIRGDITANAPEEKQGMFVVPRVVE